jgi:hypothetical protein
MKNLAITKIILILIILTICQCFRDFNPDDRYYKPYDPNECYFPGCRQRF